ncbi:uncharacterized protein [Antedon mediterranea]|uniref:uncharacterized protein n=1 Tax=Antedon mediterranea TaxID=105859 RepID=UPI003AF5324E
MEDRFTDFLQEFSDAYPGEDVQELRLLLHHHLPIGILARDNLGMNLFTELKHKGLIAYHDVNIMSEMADVTENADAKASVMRYKQEVDGFGPYRESLKERRKQLYKAMCSITETARGDFQKLIAFYDLSSYRFTNKWDLVFDLEKELKLNTLDEDSFTKFANQLNPSAKRILLGGQVDIDKNENIGLPRTVIQKFVAATVIAVIALIVAWFVLARPNAPTVTLLEQNLTSITLRIEDPEYTGGLDLIAYKISFRYKNDGQYVGESETFDYKDRNEKDFQIYTIKELSPAKLYKIRVAGKNKYMLGDQSEELDARTLTEDELIRNFLIAEQKKKFQDPNIKPPTWNAQYSNKYNIALMFTDLILKPKILKKYKYPDLEIESPTSLKELLDIIKSAESCKVCMTGEGGVGKTTLLQYISYNWATGSDSTFDGKILFLINVRDIKAGKTIRDMIVGQVNLVIFSKYLRLQKDKTIIETFIDTHEKELVVLLDGLDELEYGVGGPNIILKGDELRESTVIMTSRPGFPRDLGLFNHCDLEVIVEGFLENNIMKYIDKYFRLVKKPALGDSLIEEFKSYSQYTIGRGGDHKEIFELVQSPFLLLKMCTIWEYEKKVPNNFQHFLKEIFRSVLNQYINRSGNYTVKPIQTLDHIPSDYKNSILLLGNISYISLQKNFLHFTKLELGELVKNDTLVDLSLRLGFVYKDNPAFPDSFYETYRYSHKLLAEALAGFYLSHKIHFETLDFKESEIIRTNIYLHKTIECTISFLGSNADKLMKHWLVINVSNLYLFSQYFKFEKQEDEEKVLGSLDEYLSKSELKHIKIQIDSLKRSFKTFYNSSSHFIKLLRKLYEELEESPFKVIDKVNMFIINSTEKSPKAVCRRVAHVSLIIQLYKNRNFYRWLSVGEFGDYHLLELVHLWDNEAIEVLSNVWNMFNLSAQIRALDFNPTSLSNGLLFRTRGSTPEQLTNKSLCNFFQIFPNLQRLMISSIVINDMINECKSSKIFVYFEKCNFFRKVEYGAIIDIMKTSTHLRIIDPNKCKYIYYNMDRRVMYFSHPIFENLKDYVTIHNETWYADIEIAEYIDAGII